MKYYFQCPNCGDDEHFSKPLSDSSNMGCALFIFGGMVPSLIYLNWARQQVQCSKCGFIFSQPSFPRTPVTRLARWIIGIVILGLIATGVLAGLPLLTAEVPDYPVVLEMEKFITSHPRAIALGMMPMILLLLIVSLLASVVSSRRANEKLRMEYEYRPKDFKREDEVKAVEEKAAGNVAGKVADKVDTPAVTD